MGTRTHERNKAIYADYDKLIASGHTRKYAIEKLYLKYSIDCRFNIQRSTIRWLLDNRKRLEQ